MEEILKSIKAYLYDRSVSPLFGALVGAWIVFNYKFIVIVLSSSQYEKKIKSVDALYNNTFEIFGYAIPGQFYSWVIIPLSLSIIYLLIYPLFAIPVYKFSLVTNKWMRNIKIKSDEKRILTIEESIELTKKLAEMEVKHKEGIEKSTSEQKRFLESMNSLEADIFKLEEENAGLKGNSKTHEIKAHNIKEKLETHINLDLSGKDLRKYDFDDANLTDVNLTGANLTNVDLTNADLTNADLTNADLTGANLREVNLTGANLTNADLLGADLTDVNLTGANLTNADLTNADLSGADLRGADLTRAHLSKANLLEVDLSKANLTFADLTGANLREVNLTGADLAGADLSGADLRGAILRGAGLLGANYDSKTKWPKGWTEERLKKAGAIKKEI